MTILEKIGEPAALEQLAEECAELAQAALKLSRFERGENYTPVTKDEAVKKLIQEIADVETCLSVISECDWIDTSVLSWVIDYKMKRWKGRVNADE